MELRVCRWCQGPVPIRAGKCPRCGTPAPVNESAEGHSEKNTGRRLVRILVSYLVSAIGIYVVLEAGTAGQSRLLLAAAGVALIGICGLVSAELKPASH